MPEIYLQDPDLTLWCGDVREVLAKLPDNSVDCAVTSPPYWGLRDYSTEGQLGLEPTPECATRGMFRLRSDLTEDQRVFVLRRLMAVEEPRGV